MRRFLLIMALLFLISAAGCTKQPNKAPATTHTPTSVPTDTPTPTDEPSNTPTPAPAYKGSEGVMKIELTTADKKGIDTKEVWKKASLTVSHFDAAAGEYVQDESYDCEYKGRGNSTWNYNKKPFNVRFDEKEPLLGMAPGKHFCFIANWLDRTAMRNYLTYSIANMFTALNYSADGEYLNTGFMWSPDADYAEVYINGKYAGLFLVTESIRLAENRLELVEQDADNSVPINERGLLFELSTDGRSFETLKYLDRIRNSKGFIPYSVKDPDYTEELTAEEKKYVQDYIALVEDIIFAPKSDEAWDKICETIDITSFADFWLVQAIAANAEPEHPKSIFMYKNNDSSDFDAPRADANNGKLYAGPVWDFDWDTYTFAHSGKDFPTDTFYYDALFQYEEFRNKVRERFQLIKERLTDDALELIQTTADRISQSVANDDKLYAWRTRSGRQVNSDSLFAFSTSVYRLQSYLKLRVNTIEKQLEAME